MSQPIQQKHIIYIGLESEFYAQVSEKNNKKIAKTTIFTQTQCKDYDFRPKTAQMFPIRLCFMSIPQKKITTY